MPVLKILKEGETDIDSTDIWRFAMHSDHKNYKVGAFDNTTIVLPGGSFSRSSSITHNLGYIPVFFAYIEHLGKGYLVSGSMNNPTIQVPSGGILGYTLINFSVQATSTSLNLIAIANSSLGAPTSDQTFIIRAFFIIDEII